MSTPSADPSQESFQHIRASDGETVGTIVLTDDGDFLPIDLLGRPLGEPTDLATAEERLEVNGLRHLAEPWWIDLPDGRRVKVTIQETGPNGVVVRVDDFGAMDVYGTVHRITSPAAELHTSPPAE
ncbi:serine/threonine protein phosphatase [Kocuria sp. ZOR0020]|uniref:serine/threonine protein phosphatase n=1 Tax=Kocuria sp. ZOR0020 TaxID=1339234 RepID=UPI0018CE5D2D|nr:serine/threonine protein phosphatase [Kocuria sp. ZOR0020]